MTKQEAIELFGDTKGLATALGVTPSRVRQIPEGELAQALQDRIIGAALRTGRMKAHLVAQRAQVDRTLACTL